MIYDLAVVGLGAIGTFAVRAAATKGLTVAGFDAHHPPHAHGSTHGSTRLIRAIYSEGPYYVPLIRSAIAAWDEVNAEAGRPLYHATGAHYFAPRSHPDLEAAIATAEDGGLELVRVSDVPGIALPADWDAVFDPLGGFIEVESTLAFVQDESSRQSGVAAFLGEEVSYAFDGELWELTRKNTASKVRAKSLAVCPGPWAAQMLPFLKDHLRLERHTLHWSESGTSATGESQGFTPFLSHLENGEWIYGFPADENGLVKIAEHKFGKSCKSISEVDRDVYPSDRKVIADFAERFIPNIGAITRSSVCPYTMSPDGDFIIDHLPGGSNAACVAGLSGHGYKFAPALGRIVTELAVDGSADLDVSAFRLGRFG